MITHLEADIIEPECEVKGVLGSITMNKASGGDGIPVELFQILKNAVKVLHSISSKFGKLSSGHRTGKGEFSSQSQRKPLTLDNVILHPLYSMQKYELNMGRLQILYLILLK